MAAHCLIRYAGQTQREAARTLGLTAGAAISAMLKRIPEQLSADRALATLLRKAERHLDQLREKQAGKGD